MVADHPGGLRRPRHGLLRACVALTGLGALLAPGVAPAGPATLARTGAPQVSTLSPGLFATVSTGVALIKTYRCNGAPVASGSGFLVGETVVMTARHVLTGACTARVFVGGESIDATRWVFWRSSEKEADIGVIKLAQPSSGYIFRFRTAPPPAGTNLAMVGHPFGNRVSLNQGKIVRRLKYGRVPLIAVRMLGAKGASGSAFVDDQGRVDGILQIGIGGGEASGLLLGVELSTAWGQGPRHALCRAFPNGGIPGCGTPPPPPPPPPIEPPPPPTTAYKVANCWIQYTGGDPKTIDVTKKLYQVAGAEMLANGHDKYSAIIELESNTTRAIEGVNRSLIAPNGRVFSTNAYTWEAGYSIYWGSLNYTWATGGYFWQRPEITTTQSPGWRFVWQFPDGQSCTWYFTVT